MVLALTLSSSVGGRATALAQGMLWSEMTASRVVDTGKGSTPCCFRYLTRGVDAFGNVANYVETEQVLSVETVDSVLFFFERGTAIWRLHNDETTDCGTRKYVEFIRANTRQRSSLLGPESISLKVLSIGTYNSSFTRRAGTCIFAFTSAC